MGRGSRIPYHLLWYYYSTTPGVVSGIPSRQGNPLPDAWDPSSRRSWRAGLMWPIADAGQGKPHARVHAGFYNLWNKSALGANVRG